MDIDANQYIFTKNIELESDPQVLSSKKFSRLSSAGRSSSDYYADNHGVDNAGDGKEYFSHGSKKSRKS